MIQFLETLPGKILLIVTVGLVWGVNVINFSHMTNQESAIASNSDIALISVELPEINSYSYQVKNRDPFRMGSYRPEPQQIIQEEPVIVEQMPLIRLIGVMGTTSVLQIANSQTVIREAGEKVVGNVLLEQVFEDSVHVIFNDKTITIKLNN